MTSKADIPRIAANLRLVGEILEAHGDDCWSTTEDWDRGVAAQALTGTGHSTDVSDPTHNAAGTDDPDYHQRFRKLLDRLSVDSRELANLINATNPSLITRPVRAVDHSVGDEGWCVSCHRDDRWCEPISERYNGKGLCRWCGDFESAHKFWPTPGLLKDRHRGKRITKQQVEAAIQTHRAAPKPKKGKKKGWQSAA